MPDGDPAKRSTDRNRTIITVATIAVVAAIAITAIVTLGGKPSTIRATSTTTRPKPTSTTVAPSTSTLPGPCHRPRRFLRQRHRHRSLPIPPVRWFGRPENRSPRRVETTRAITAASVRFLMVWTEVAAPGARGVMQLGRTRAAITSTGGSADYGSYSAGYLGIVKTSVLAEDGAIIICRVPMTCFQPHSIRAGCA